MDINDRLQAITDEIYNGNKTAFASEIGVRPSVITNFTGKRKGKPSFEILQKIMKFTDINIRWLMTGEGEMTVNNEEKEKFRDTPVRVPDEVPGGIPLIPMDAMAGAFTGEMTIMENECERYIIPNMHRADFMIYISGDSMMPSYFPADIVACVRVPIKDVFFQYGRVYVLDTNQGAIIKRIEKSDDEDSILIVSDNEKYSPFTLHLSQVRSIALVIGLIRLE